MLNDVALGSEFVLSGSFYSTVQYGEVQYGTIPVL